MHPLSSDLFGFNPMEHFLWSTCFSRMCRGVLFVVLWLLIGTRSCLLVVGPLSITEPLIVPLSVSLWNALSDPVFDGVGLVGFKSRANAFLLA